MRAEPLGPRGDARQSSLAVVNAETLSHLDLLGSSPAFLEKLIGVYLADTTALMAKVSAAVATSNTGELRAALHAVKGCSASMGVDRMTQLCSDFGKLSDAELRLRGSGLAAALTAEFSAARAELERYVRSRQKSAS